MHLLPVGPILALLGTIRTFTWDHLVLVVGTLWAILSYLGSMLRPGCFRSAFEMPQDTMPAGLGPDSGPLYTYSLYIFVEGTNMYVLIVCSFPSVFVGKMHIWSRKAGSDLCALLQVCSGHLGSQDLRRRRPSATFFQ